MLITILQSAGQPRTAKDYGPKMSMALKLGDPASCRAKLPPWEAHFPLSLRSWPPVASAPTGGSRGSSLDHPHLQGDQESGFRSLALSLFALCPRSRAYPERTGQRTQRENQSRSGFVTYSSGAVSTGATGVIKRVPSLSL